MTQVLVQNITVVLLLFKLEIHPAISKFQKHY